MQNLRRDHQKSNDAPFIIMVGLNMPRTNGHAAVTTLRDDRDLTKITALILTSPGERSDIEFARHQYVAGYFVKDRAGDEFIDLIPVLENFGKLVEFPDGAKWTN